MSRVLLKHVGEGPRRAVLEIEGIFDFVQTEGRPGLVILSGSQGIGKTRVVQELFAALSSKQRGKPYWTAEIVQPDEEGPHERHREKISPSRAASLNARRRMLWYAQSCRKAADGSGVDLPSAQLASQQLERLHPKQGLERVIRNVFLGAMAVGLVTEVISGIVAVPSVLMWITRVTGVVGLVMSAKDLARSVLDNRDERVNATKSDVSNSQIAYLNQSFRFIRRESVLRRVPSIVVIDNLQDADSATIDFIEELLRLHGPILVIATRWLTGTQDLVGRSEIDSLNDKATFITLGALTPPETAELLRVHHPSMPQVLIDALADHADGMPYIALTLATLPAVKRLDATSLSTEEVISEVRQLPRDSKGLTKTQWQALPDELQEFLAVASIFGEVIPTQLVRETFAKYFGTDSERVHQQVRNPYWWLEILQNDIDHFPNGDLYRLAREQASQILPRKMLDEIEASVAALEDVELPEPLRSQGVFGGLTNESRWEKRVLLGLAKRTIDDVEHALSRIFVLDGSRYVETRAELALEQIKWLEEFQSKDDQEEARRVSLLITFRYYHLKTIAMTNPAEAIRLGENLLSSMGDHPYRCDLILRLGNYHLALEDYAEATRYLESVAKSRDCSWLHHTAQHNLCLIMARNGDLKGAIRKLKRVNLRFRISTMPSRIFDIFTRAPRDYSLSRAPGGGRFNIGWWHAQLGNFRRASLNLRFDRWVTSRLADTSRNHDQRLKIHCALVELEFSRSRFRQAERLTKSFLLRADARFPHSHDNPTHPQSIRMRLLNIACQAALGDPQGARVSLARLTQYLNENSVDLTNVRDQMSLIDQFADTPAELVSKMKWF